MVHELIGEIAGNPYRLGRHVWHDDRSLGFPAGVLPRSAIRSRRWPSHLGPLNQNGLGSCVGNTFTRVLSCDPCWEPVGHLLGLDEAYAVALYADATRVDPFPGAYPPDDTGTSGLAAAKVLRRRGVVRSYRHAFSLHAVLSTLQSRPVAAGMPWRRSMFDVGSDGHIVFDPASEVAGGHEVAVDEVDVEAGRVWLHNSWGAGWGADGRGWLGYHEWECCLAAQGDVTALDMPLAP